MRVPIRRAQLKPRDDRGAQYLTKDGVQRMENELKRLQAEQPQAVEEVVRTGAMGDFSENAEYQEAKFRLRRINDRITSLKERLKHVVIIEKGGDASGRVEIGSTVVVQVNEKTKTYFIVGPQESNPTQGRISFVSPLGTALMDHVVGDVVILQTENGEVSYTIMEVK
ncbi:transcription elongation factor GreA [Candidatus Uhrbacteria bacterium]|nr:transcription elongation factor GreA [Candidatus Uhrbacteria bacterium]